MNMNMSRRGYHNGYQREEYNEEDMSPTCYPMYSNREKLNNNNYYLNQIPQIGQGSGPGSGTVPGDNRAYYYPHPNSQQYVLPYSQNIIYPNSTFQPPYSSSYSPGSVNSDFIESQMVYYSPPPYNYPVHVSTFPNPNQINHEPSIIPASLQNKIQNQNQNQISNQNHNSNQNQNQGQAIYRNGKT